MFIFIIKQTLIYILVFSCIFVHLLLTFVIIWSVANRNKDNSASVLAIPTIQLSEWLIKPLTARNTVRIYIKIFLLKLVFGWSQTKGTMCFPKHVLKLFANTFPVGPDGRIKNVLFPHTTPTKNFSRLYSFLCNVLCMLKIHRVYAKRAFQRSTGELCILFQWNSQI